MGYLLGGRWDGIGFRRELLRPCWPRFRLSGRGGGEIRSPRRRVFLGLLKPEL
jgi:hypothetical protein